jgi:hypothetical protein
VFDTICINFSKIDQAVAAVMVTVGATQCMSRANSERTHGGNPAGGLCHYGYLQSGRAVRVSV